MPGAAAPRAPRACFTSMRRRGAVRPALHRPAGTVRRGDLLVLNARACSRHALLGVRLPGGGAVECLLVRRDPAPTMLRRMPRPGAPWSTRGSGCGPARLVFDGPGRVAARPHPRPAFTAADRALSTADGSPVRDTVHDRSRAVAALHPQCDAGDDRDRYQTVYARHEGSIAAPTAGLHFTPERDRGAPRAAGIATAIDHAARGLRHLPADARRRSSPIIGWRPRTTR